MPRIPILKYNSSTNSISGSESELDATTFQEKCQAFLSTLFQKPPSSEPIDWASIPSQSKWEWLEIGDIEIKEAIFSSSTKKAPGLDKLSFLIIQKAYENLKPRFNKLYKTLIREGYHPKCWKVANGVILRKGANQKRDFSKPKAYRVVSLLNCLGKVSEKILAIRLAKMSDLPDSDLLYYDQIGGRKGRSAIDTVLSLIHDIQMAKNAGNKTSILFIDIKGAFDHVLKNQMLRICIRLGLPRNLIQWIASFLSDRQIALAFDTEISLMSPLEIGIPQGSPISPILFLIYIRFLFNINIEEIRRSQTNSEVSDSEVSDSEVSDSEEGSISKVLIRKPSYIDDIGIVVSSKSLETNARYLEIIAKTIFQKGKSNVI